MKVHYFSPYSIEKDLGSEYNYYMSLISDEDFACFTDGDVLFLTPNFGDIIYNYVKQNPDCVLTCRTNRIHKTATDQLSTRSFAQSHNILDHILIAESIRGNYITTECKSNLSGFLMVVPKKVWLKTPFREDIGLLGVDTMFYKDLRREGIKILRMESLYVWHTYRLGKSITDTKHLQ